jgi:hypothetical protein
MNVLSKYNLKVEKDYPELDTKIDEKRIMEICYLKIHLFKELNESRNRKKLIMKNETKKTNKKKFEQSNVITQTDEFYNKNIMVGDISKKEQKVVIRRRKKRMRILRFKKIVKQKKKRNKMKKNFLKCRKVQIQYILFT